MQYRNYNIESLCSAIDADIPKIRALSENLSQSYNRIINDIAISFDWEGTVQKEVVSKIEEIKKNYKVLHDEIGNLNGIINYSTDLKTNLLEYKRIQEELVGLNSSYRLTINNLRIPNLDELEKADLETSKRKYQNSINSMNSRIKEISIRIDNLLDKLKSVEFTKRIGDKPSGLKALLRSLTGKNNIGMYTDTATSGAGVLQTPIVDTISSATTQDSFDGQKVTPIINTVTPEITPISTQSPTQVSAPSSTEMPTQEPTEVPTQAPTQEPTEVPTQVPTQEPISQVQNQYLKSNNIIDMDSNGNYSRVINYQGANWNYFNMKDPKWSNWLLDRNSAGFKELSRNGTHPFATINILANSGLIAGKKEDVVLDVLGVSGKQTKIDGKRVGDTTLNLTSGPVKIGTGNKYKTILSKSGISSTDLGSLNAAIKEVEKGNIVHCIAQEGSTMAKYGHYLNLVGVEKDKNGSLTGLYVLDSLGRSQSEYDALSGKPNSSELVRVIEPGLVRIDTSKENLDDVRLSSFRAINGGKSQTKTVLSYEEYLKQF